MFGSSSFYSFAGHLLKNHLSYILKLQVFFFWIWGFVFVVVILSLLSFIIGWSFNIVHFHGGLGYKKNRLDNGSIT